MKRVLVREEGALNDLLYIDPEQFRDHVKLCERLSEDRRNTTGDMVMLGEVPGEVVEKYCNERGIPFASFIRSTELQTEFINSEYARPFRVWGRGNNLKF